MLMADAPPDRVQQLLDLAHQISALSAQLKRLLLVEQPLPPIPPPPPRSSDFVVGDRVLILNSYRGLRGQQGLITRVTRVFIFFVLTLPVRSRPGVALTFVSSLVLSKHVELVFACGSRRSAA